MADVVFNDEDQLRSRRRGQAPRASESAIVNFLIEKRIVKDVKHANWYVLGFIGVVLLASLYFTDRAGVTDIGIGSSRDNEAPLLTPEETILQFGDA